MAAKKKKGEFVYDPDSPMPLPAQELLKRAAAVDPKAAPGTSVERRIAVEEAIKEVKQRYPYMFRN